MLIARRDMNSNQLTGIPSSIVSLTALAYLRVYIAPRHVLGQLRLIARRVLHSNKLTGTIPIGIGSLTSLNVLCVHVNLAH
jgi:hypothetical protein